MTAYSIAQLLKHKGHHEIEIFVVDNSPTDDSKRYFQPFEDQIHYFEYPSERLQSHGIAFDYVIPFVETEYFITIESDSFPVWGGWLDYYEELIDADVDAAGSILTLSGGVYFHPCGMLYKKSVWQEAKAYCETIEYKYFPNMSMKESFACHLMVHNSVLEKFLEEPEDYIILSEGYKPYSKQKAMERAAYYLPTCNPFHNGMGSNQESVLTYGQRTFSIDVPNVLLNNKQKLIGRIGYEPGQWLTYWMFAMNKKVVSIPTEVKWLKNRENEQQEYTLNRAGFKHLWCGSAYLDMKGGDFNDVYEFKHNQIEGLYNSLPEEQKIEECQKISS